MTFPALPRATATAGTPQPVPGWQQPPARRCGQAGLCKDKGLVFFFPPSLLSSAPPLTLLEERQKRGEVPAHENHHGGQGKGLLPVGGGALPLPVVPGGPLSSLSPSSSAPQEPAGGCPAGGAAAQGERMEPGSAARRQEGTAPAAPSALLGAGGGEQKSRAPPLALPPPPCTQPVGSDPAWSLGRAPRGS